MQLLGGALVSITNAMLFLSPLMLRWVQRSSVRVAVRTGFLCASAGFLLAALSPLPLLAVACLFAASGFLILLDISGGLPFLMAVKPSERTEMAAVYASFRDVSGILTPAVAGLVLTVAPVAGVFAACGAGMAAASAIAAKLHPRLGAPRPLAV